MASKKRKGDQRDDLPSASDPRGGFYGFPRLHRLNPYPLDLMVGAEAEAPGLPPPPPPPQEGAEVRRRRLLAQLSRENFISLLCSTTASNPRVLEEIHHALGLPVSGSASSRHRRDQQLRPNPNPDRDPRNPGVCTGNKGESLYEFFSRYDDTEERALFKNRGDQNLQIRQPPDGSAGRDSQQ